jgi:hypothetical protein
MKPERLVAIKQQALKSLSAKASNPNVQGCAMVVVSPHEALEMVEAVEKATNDQDQQQTVP